MHTLFPYVHSDSISPPLSVAILRALVAWVELRKDFEISFFAPVTKVLMQFCLLPSSSKGEIVIIIILCSCKFQLELV
jgi:hypothetical protein